MKWKTEKHVPKNRHWQNGNTVTTAFTHIGYTCLGFCFSSWHSALGGEKDDALGCSGPSFFQLVRYQLRDLCKHHIAVNKDLQVKLMPARKCLRWPLAAENSTALSSPLPLVILDHSSKGNGQNTATWSWTNSWGPSCWVCVLELKGEYLTKGKKAPYKAVR